VTTVELSAGQFDVITWGLALLLLVQLVSLVSGWGRRG
jgi:hypothetical protein